ncbi:unnamed protein product, partial [Musa acuminata subsp. malaccensis]
EEVAGSTRTLKFTLPIFTFQDRLTNLKKIILTCIFIDQSELHSKTNNCLKRSNIHILLDPLNKSQEDPMRTEYDHIEDVKEILDTLQKHFRIGLPKNKFSF